MQKGGKWWNLKSKLPETFKGTCYEYITKVLYWWENPTKKLNFWVTSHFKRVNPMEKKIYTSGHFWVMIIKLFQNFENKLCLSYKLQVMSQVDLHRNILICGWVRDPSYPTSFSWFSNCVFLMKSVRKVVTL